MNEPSRTARERADAFVGRLRGVREDRGKRAALRRGLSSNPRMRVDAWPVIANLGGDIGQPVFGAVAALYASHAEESNARNFGETCRRIARDGGEDISESIERRFRRLLACGDVDDVIGQLRTWIRLAASKNVGVNFESLFADLWNWRWYADDIRVNWARSFWQSADMSAESHVAISTPS